MDLTAPKGTFDILPYGIDETWRLAHIWHHIEAEIRKLAADYGYSEIRTPIYEQAALFNRGVGETSDIVMKEMFTFSDKGDRQMSLRPEGTAAVMRALLEHRLPALRPVHKFFYIGPMFRYERPQSGRYRQHHQFGIEAIGIAGPEQDAEAIDVLFTLYKRLGLKNVKVHLNTVGDTSSRQTFREALRDFLHPRFSELSADSQIRFEKNPLRILDSKDPKDKEILKGAPSILDSLSSEARDHFEKVQELLSQIGIPYLIDDKLVRGLDYYNKTVFEVISHNLGAQNTLGGGGRFDGLIASLGGPDLPAIGFASGLERVLQALLAEEAFFPPPSAPLLYFIPLGEEAKRECLKLATACRRAHIATDLELHAKKMQTALQNALKIGATYCIIIGSEELAKGQAQLKHLHTREQREIPLTSLLETVQSLSKSANP